MLSEKLDAASKDPTLLLDHKKRVDEVIHILEPYKLYAMNLMMDKKHIFGNNFKKDFNAKNYVKNNTDNGYEKSWTNKNPKYNMNSLKRKEEGNWRTLKPDPISNPSIFSQGYQKQTSNNGMEIKSRFNRYK